MDEFELAGSYRELGRRFAERLAERGRSLDDVSPEPLDPSDARRAFAAECVPHVETHAPFLLEELAGIAAATGRGLEAVRSVPLAVDAEPGCSVVAIGGERSAADGPLFGRNLDFHPSFRRFSTLYRTRPDDGLDSVGGGFTPGGRLDGVNEAGLAIGFAGVPTDEYEPGVSWPIAIRTVLDTCRSVSEAASTLAAMPHVRNANFLLADAGGDLAVVEAGPADVEVTRPDRDWIAVTNQFRSESMRAHQSVPREPADCPRLQTFESLLADGSGASAESDAVSLLDLQTAMGDPDAGVCWRLDETGDDPRSTIWSWAMALDAGKARLARDSPVRTRYEPVAVPRVARRAGSRAERN